METGFAFFETAVGCCGIAWGPDGLLGVALPEATGERGTRSFARRFPELTEQVPPPTVAAVIAAITAHLAGARDDLRWVKLDQKGTGSFEAAVYEAARAIPPGETRSYGQLAAAIGDPGQARAVGQALGRNPWPIVVPCHRITAAEGRTGGFSAPGGTVAKLKLLEIEGALAVEALPLFAPGPAA